MPKRSETRARNYTVEELKRLGWNTKHPNRGGHILEENEIFNFDERFKELLQLDKPDYLIFKNNKPIAIIECKSDKTKFDEAVKDLKYYANKLNKKYFKINFLIAVSGSKEEGVIVRNYYFNGSQWEEIKANNYPLTQIIKPDQIDSVDQTPWEAGKRELWEELGISPQKVTQIRGITPVYIPPSRFWVDCFLAYSTSQIELNLDPNEVKEVISVSLAEFINIKKSFTDQLDSNGNKTPIYTLSDNTVWGATAMILAEIKSIIFKALN